MITIKFFSLIRLLIKKSELIIEGDNLVVREVLKISQSKIKTEFLHKLVNDESEMHTGTIILINGKNVHHLENLDTLVKDGDVVSLFPPGGGG